MSTIISLQHFWGLLLLSLSLYVNSSTSAKPSDVYIVYLGMNRIHDPSLTTDFHVQLLSNVFPSEEDAKRAMVYSYKHSFSGFSAMLDSTQASVLANRKEVISVFKSKTLHLHTTRSWDFLGLSLANMNMSIPTNINNNSDNGKVGYLNGDDVVVGIIDSGIWPESKSFREEEGMKPVPSTWRGTCRDGEMFDAKEACNRKLIGARFYLEGFERKHGPLNSSGNPEYRSARDFVGHGTHTASTAVGAVVEEMSFVGGLGRGIGRGGAPRARLAVYKACWGKNYDSICNEADIIAAFDDALYDGVHVISASFGKSPPLSPFLSSSAAIGSFHAAQLGVSVVFSAGNDGPDPGLVTNVAPWSLSVAASSIDRLFSTRILVDAKLSLMGESFITAPIKAKLVDAFPYFINEICRVDNRKNVSKTAEGKVMVCFSSNGLVSVEEAAEAANTVSASALIFVEPTVKLTLLQTIPTLHLDLRQGTLLEHYLVSSKKTPTVRIEASKTIIGKSPAPTVAFFSSRGPSSLAPDILKPDISAPGVNILAAWPEKTPPTLKEEDKRRVRWNIQSGSSMACPHVSAITALLKSKHPKWSPAAIRSALITTATTSSSSFPSLFPILDAASMKPANPFDVGSGQVNPLKAFDPGLVYDIEISDYVLFLCSLGYTQQQIEAMLFPGCHYSCPDPSPHAFFISNINYPSISITLSLTHLLSYATLTRKVRNVGQNTNVIYYLSNLIKPYGVHVVIRPRVLAFSWFKRELTYHITFFPLPSFSPPPSLCDFGEIVWSDGIHHVRSPLIVCFDATTSVVPLPPPNILFPNPK